MHPFTTIVGADTTKMEKRVCSSVAALSGDRCMEMFYYSYISKYTVTTCKYVYTCIRVCIYIYIHVHLYRDIIIMYKGIYISLIPFVYTDIDDGKCRYISLVVPIERLNLSFSLPSFRRNAFQKWFSESISADVYRTCATWVWVKLCAMWKMVTSPCPWIENPWFSCIVYIVYIIVYVSVCIYYIQFRCFSYSRICRILKLVPWHSKSIWIFSGSRLINALKLP